MSPGLLCYLERISRSACLHFDCKMRSKIGAKEGGPLLMFYVCLNIYDQAQKEGRALSISQLRTGLVLLPHYQINDLLELLQRQKWVNESKGSWLLSKDLKETCLYDLHKILPVRLPVTGSELKNDQLSNNLKSQLCDYHKQVEGNLSVSIAEFLKGIDVSDIPDIETQI